MSLSKYIKKRNFNSTNEPQAQIVESSRELIFVVQKHAASHLHYDFRLEMKGVLKSWAIPKGPSMNPADKRLAIMVEDHPYAYKDFEGTIPEGNYGAGKVIVWDRGSYSLVDNTENIQETFNEGLKNGHLGFILKGKKLKGEFAFVKLKGKQDNAWLLIKKKDEFVIADDILQQDKSVISNQTLEDMV